MPHSQTTQLGKIVNVMKQRSPTSILDVGVGMGVYGFLARMFVNLEDLFYIDGEHSRYKTMDERTIRIDGIEGFAKYLNPVHDFVYNRMMTGNALEICRPLRISRTTWYWPLIFWSILPVKMA